MKTRSNILKYLISSTVLGLTLCATSSASGDTLTSGEFNSDSVLDLVGTEVSGYGVDFGGSGALTTSNGFAFSPGESAVESDNTKQEFDPFLAGGATTGDANFNSVLTTGRYDAGNGLPATYTLSGLMGDTTYNLLFLDVDTRGGSAGITFTEGPSATFSTASDDITQEFGFTSGKTSASDPQGAGSTEIGGYILDTFTTGKDQTTASFEVQTDNTTTGQLNALVLGTAATPEPSTYVFLGLGMLALVFVGRGAGAKL